MRFDRAILSAFAATLFTTATAGGDQVLSKGAQATTQFAAAVCGLGVYICSANGSKVGACTFSVAGFCCASTGAVVTASESEKYQAAWKKTVQAAKKEAKRVGGAVKATEANLRKAGNLAVDCGSAGCKLVAKAANVATRKAKKLNKKKKKCPILPTRANMSRRGRRSITKYDLERIAKSSANARRAERIAQRSIDGLGRQRFA